MVGHGGSSAGSYLADPTSPIPSHCASIVVTSTLRVNGVKFRGLGDCYKAIVAVHKIICFLGIFLFFVLFLGGGLTSNNRRNISK